MKSQHEVIVIAADEKPKQVDWSERQIRVAAYCRVSTDDEEQLTSYDAQIDYYTAKIMENPNWIMAGIFADEGISATSAKKRPDFQKMIRKCKQGKIDLILTKSVSRFARNTLDCIQSTRQLREWGVAVQFEKENINTMEMDGELQLTIIGSLAQAESESISKNVAWGKRQAMKSGKVSFQYARIYGYERGEDDMPKIIPEQAEVIRRIFNWYLSGTSVTDIIARLEEECVPSPAGKQQWSDPTVRKILSNIKYSGDVLSQTTFVENIFTRRVVKNTGQLPKYYIKDYHDPIVSRDIYNKAQAEMSRRRNKPSDKNDKAIPGKKYSSKYALTGIMLCEECGSIYKRTVWTRRSGEKKPVWRCTNRIQNGLKYCKKSPTIFEDDLQRAILLAIALNFKPEDWQMEDHIPVKLSQREWSIGDSDEIKLLKRSLVYLLEADKINESMADVEVEITRLQGATQDQEDTTSSPSEEKVFTPLSWDETLIWNMVGKVIVRTDGKPLLKFRNGKQVEAKVGI